MWEYRAIHGLAVCERTACAAGTEGLALVTGLFCSLTRQTVELCEKAGKICPVF